MTDDTISRVDPPGGRVRAHVAAATVCDGIAYLSGVVPVDDQGNLVGAGDPKAQARACLDEIERVLQSAGSSLDHILRSTAFATCAEAGRAYIEERTARMRTRPAAATVVVSELLIPGAMLEIEITARVAAPSVDAPSV